MNRNYGKMLKMAPISQTISEALLKIKEKSPEEKVDLVDIVKKLSSKKFENS